MHPVGSYFAKIETFGAKRQKKIKKNLIFTGRRIGESESPVYKGREALYLCQPSV